MSEIFLVDGANYKLLDGEYLTYGHVGVYVWNKGKNESGFDVYPPKRLFVYGYVKEVREE